MHVQSANVPLYRATTYCPLAFSTYYSCTLEWWDVRTPGAFLEHFRFARHIYIYMYIYLKFQWVSSVSQLRFARWIKYVRHFQNVLLKCQLFLFIFRTQQRLNLFETAWCETRCVCMCVCVCARACACVCVHNYTWGRGLTCLLIFPPESVNYDQCYSCLIMQWKIFIAFFKSIFYSMLQSMGHPNTHTHTHTYKDTNADQMTLDLVHAG